MLLKQQTIQFSAHSTLYDLIVPKENILRKINDLIDFSFIYDELLNKYCTSNGRMAESLVRMFKYVLLKTIYTFDDQFKERMPQKNTDNDLEKELVYCKELEKRIENEPSISSISAVKEKLNLLKETVEDTQENLTLSKDTDAKIGHKSAESSFFGYKTYLAMTQERIITAAVVTSGEKGDGPELPKLIEISQENGIDVDTIIGDAAYSGKENLKIASEQNIKVVARLNPSIT